MDSNSSMSSVDSPPHLIAQRPNPTATEAYSTRVYYHVDDEPTPYQTTVHIPPNHFTLAHFKCALGRSNFKCYISQMDENLQREVKAEILDEHSRLAPNYNGHFLLYLLTNDVVPERGVASRLTAKKKKLPNLRPFGVADRKQSAVYHNLDPQRHHDYRPQSLSESETSIDFTTISEMEDRRIRKRRGRTRRREKSFSYFSSNCDDTDISMSMNLLTVPLNLSSGREFGIHVMMKRFGGTESVYVSKIDAGSVAALDGRIQPNMLITEVNGHSLDHFPSADDAVKFLQSAVTTAAHHNGTITLTLCEDLSAQRPRFLNLPDESVRPLDMECWRDSVNVAMAEAKVLPKLPNQNWPSSGVGSSISTNSLGNSKRFSINMPMDIVVRGMAHLTTGVLRGDHTHLNLTMSDSFTGQDLINWLGDNVAGLDDTKSCERYGGELLRNGYILQQFKKDSFTSVCYYTINESRLSNTLRRGVLTPYNGDMLLIDSPKKHRCNRGCTIRRLLCIHENHK